MIAKRAIIVLSVLLVWCFYPYVLFGVPETASLFGGAMVLASRLGTALAPMILGGIGLFYSPNRWMGWVVATSIAAIAVAAGSK
jgi:hypothetical protein